MEGVHPMVMIKSSTRLGLPMLNPSYLVTYHLELAVGPALDRYFATAELKNQDIDTPIISRFEIKLSPHYDHPPNTRTHCGTRVWHQPHLNSWYDARNL
jgi:hypothetical protein